MSGVFALAPVLARAVAGPPTTRAHKSEVEPPATWAEWGLGYAVAVEPPSPPLPSSAPAAHPTESAAPTSPADASARRRAPRSVRPRRGAASPEAEADRATERALIHQVDF